MIKVTLSEKPQQESKPFPKLMIATNDKRTNIVLFEKYGVGVLVKGENEIVKNGQSYSNWLMDAFTDYNEPITLQNL